jgi:hypothetical protein
MLILLAIHMGGGGKDGKLILNLSNPVSDTLNFHLWKMYDIGGGAYSRGGGMCA